MAAHNDLGKWGEEVAAEFLASNGYTILERDWKDGHRDIDIIARTADETIVFVEVKTRTFDAIAKPEDAITKQKIKSIGKAANAYVKAYQLWNELRFDVITIIGNRKENAQINHIADAFNPLLV
ncbi:MAG: YraN family protein [Prevotella sp.]|jgi:putative endonuclease|nr:YraN family protein [Prevotella sp.]MEE3416222.1 YraN family protein [Prevotella sp.]